MKRSLLIAALPLCAFVVPAAGCAAPTDDAASTSEHAVEVRAPDLWAGNVSYALERSAADPCNFGRNRLDDAPIVYDAWARSRAGTRNICFEVWKPGVTDTDNADFWRLLDVKVHYRYKGTEAWKTAPVPSIDRRGNNRRYAWTLPFHLDPVATSNVTSITAPFEITGEDDSSAQVRAELELYFTVNGHELSSSSNGRFRVAYQGVVQKPGIEATAGPLVLHPEVTCAGLRAGGGAGHYAVDITDPAAIDALSAAVGPSMIAGPRLGMSGQGTSRVLSLTFASKANQPAGSLPRYVDTYSAEATSWSAETRDTGAGALTVTIKAYDRNARAQTQLTHTFTSCTTP